MTNNIQFKIKRQKLVDLLHSKGISNNNVLAAINKVQRHLFMPHLEKFAYEDRAFPIAAEQTISQPYTVAFQSQLLEVKKGDKILEVGTGSGYQCAVLLEMGAKVLSIERILELFEITYNLLHNNGYNAQLFHGDGYAGKPTYGPFDKILLTAGAPNIPLELLKQLKVGGFFVGPIGSGKSQIMTKIIKVGENAFEKKEFGNFAFVPMLKGRK